MSNFARTTTKSAVHLVEYCEAQGYAAPAAGTLSHNSSQLKSKLSLYLGNTATANGVALTMAVQPTIFNPTTEEAVASDEGLSVSDSEMAVMVQEAALTMGYETADAFETAQDTGPIAAVHMNCPREQCPARLPLATSIRSSHNSFLPTGRLKLVFTSTLLASRHTRLSTSTTSLTSTPLVLLATISRYDRYCAMPNPPSYFTSNPDS